MDNIKKRYTILPKLLSFDILQRDQTGKYKGYSMHIYGNESNNEIPHLHIDNKLKNLHTAIKLSSPEYYLHGKCKDTLKKKDIKEINNFLDSNDNWKNIVELWNNYHENNKITVMEKPNYTKIKL